MKDFYITLVSFICIVLVSCSGSKLNTQANKSESLKQRSNSNVILILVDDLGWTDVSYNGSTFYETPHIDRLAASSYNFTNAYASASICSPSRAAILTGKHPVSIGITDWLPGQDPKDRARLGAQDLGELPLHEVTLAEVLKQSQYKTSFIGKWHLGGEGFYPEDQGFDTNIGGHDKGSPPGGYYSPYKNPKLTDGLEGEYLTDRLTEEGINFIDKNHEDPFFLMLSYYTVHTPIQANTKHLAKFETKLSELTDSSIKTKEEGGGISVLNQVNPAYASMVYSLDENIGRLITQLKQNNLYDHTTIIFTSDNGGLSTLEKGRKNPAPTSVLPLRGGKGWLFEGGIRVPLLIKPAYHEGNSAVIEEPVVGHDLFPTICSMTGTELPIDVEIDGFDLKPLMNGSDSLAREYLYWHYPHYHGSGWTPGAAIRKGKWKVIEFYAEEKVEMYNLEEDISETENVFMDNGIDFLDMRIQLMKFQVAQKAKFSEKNPDYINKE